MRGPGPRLGLGLAVLAASFGAVISCGDTGSDEPSGNNAGSAGDSVSGAGGAASAGKSGSATGGSSAGTTIAGAAASGGTNGGSAAGGTDLGGGGADSELVSCDQRQVSCKRLLPNCPANQVPSVVGNCYGDCVDIASCACSQADDCPDTNQYTCWSKQHCGPFVR